MTAVGAGDGPVGVLERVRELVGLVGEAYGTVVVAERDLEALDGASDAQALRSALAEFDRMWGALGPDERARVLALVLEEVVVDAGTGDAQLRINSCE